MVAMWDRMASYFPHWESALGTVEDHTIHTWQGALDQFTEAELAGAIRACEDWEGKYIPTFPEFKALCLAARGAARKNFTDQRIEREKDRPKTIEDYSKKQRGDSPTAVREKKRIARLMAGEELNETKEKSMHILGLNRR